VRADCSGAAGARVGTEVQCGLVRGVGDCPGEVSQVEAKVWWSKCEGRQMLKRSGEWLILQGADPGSPWQSWKCESFNGKFRDKCLNAQWFRTLREAKVLIEIWRKEYNSYRPQRSLGYVTPLKNTALRVVIGAQCSIFDG
jgi:hypothetical protein